MSEISPVTDGMIKIHRLLTRALSVSVVKCDEYIRNKAIPSSESKGFLLYLTTLVRVMHAHHMGEDDVVFPELTGKIEAPYDRLKQEHIKMSLMLDELAKDLENVTLAGLPKLRKALDGIQRLWAPHITTEEVSFTDALISNRFSDAEQKDLIERIGKHSQKASGPGPLTLPFVLYNLNKEDRQTFLKDFPWILRKILIPVIWRSQWKPMDPFLLN